MGVKWLHSPVGREYLQKLEAAIGKAPASVLMGDDEELLKQTTYAQPSILTISSVMTRELLQAGAPPPTTPFAAFASDATSPAAAPVKAASFGAVIVLVAAVIFVVSMLFGPARGVVPRSWRQARLRRKVGRQHLLRAAYEILEGQQPDVAEPIRNLPIALDSLMTHRSWSAQQVNRLLRTARTEDHLEGAGQGQVRLSEAGFGEAARVTRNHRLWELYLIHYADIAPSHVDRDADLVEHVLDAEVVHQLESELQDRPSSLEVPPSPHFIDQHAES